VCVLFISSLSGSVLFLGFVYRYHYLFGGGGGGGGISTTLQMQRKKCGKKNPPFPLPTSSNPAITQRH